MVIIFVLMPTENLYPQSWIVSNKKNSWECHVVITNSPVYNDIEYLVLTVIYIEFLNRNVEILDLNENVSRMFESLRINSSR